jgi:hypothetical protein
MSWRFEEEQENAGHHDSLEVPNKASYRLSSSPNHPSLAEYKIEHGLDYKWSKDGGNDVRMGPTPG